MNTPNKNSTSGDLRLEIITAAHARFLLYGLNKTTMAEIAADVSMSASNLYRYFKNKQDIATACAERCMTSQNEHLKKVTRQKHLSATQRLTAFALEAFRYNYNSMKDMPKINALVIVVTENNPEMIRSQMNRQIALIAEILAYGNENGEFFVNDIIETAQTLYSTLLLFDVPIFIPLFSEAEFENKAHHIVTLVINGIKKH